MGYFAAFGGAGLLLAALVAGVSCGSAHPPPLADECLTLHCGSAADAGVDDGGIADAQVMTSDVTSSSQDGKGLVIEGGAMLSDGPPASITGTIGAMSPPLFSPYWNDLTPLSQPATVHVPMNGKDYTGQYRQGSFTLSGVPEGASLEMVSDVSDANGIMDTVLGVPSIRNGAMWQLPAMRTQDLKTIYDAQPVPVALDITKAQLVVSVHGAAFGGDMPLAGVSLTAPASERVLYDVDSGYAAGTATGAAGMAIITDVDAMPYPGSAVTLVYQYGGATITGPEVYLVKGAVTRAEISVASP